jgi:Haemolysin secretion/activation protein ShlB/FhaC/HecB
VLALRSTLSCGLDALGATQNSGDIPDGQFFAWLGQLQWVRRLWDTDNQVLIRNQVQWAADPLLALEKLGVGGGSTVRGYRENLLVRDRGFVGSVELRFPVFRLPLPFISRRPEDGQVQLATFYDFGWSENVEEASPNPRPSPARALAWAGIRTRDLLGACVSQCQQGRRRPAGRRGPFRLGHAIVLVSFVCRRSARYPERVSWVWMRWRLNAETLMRLKAPGSKDQAC